MLALYTRLETLLSISPVGLEPVTEEQMETLCSSVYPYEGKLAVEGSFCGRHTAVRICRDGEDVMTSILSDIHMHNRDVTDQ